VSKRKTNEPQGVPEGVRNTGGRLLSELCTLVAVCRVEGAAEDEMTPKRVALRAMAQAVCDREAGDDSDWRVFRTRLRKVLEMYADELEAMDPKPPGGTK
jgi:hypothetical protein